MSMLCLAEESMIRSPGILLFALGYAAICMSIASSLGMLLVPSVAAEFGIPVATAQWMLTVNMLCGAVTTPIVGRLIDGRYKRALLLTVLAIVLVGSIIASLATDFGVFLVGRALQGLTFGIGPIAIALARTQLPSPMVPRSIAALAITAATGLGLGYPLTGVLSGLFGFRSAFVFAIVFVITVAIVVLIAMPGGADPAVTRQPFDLAGAVLFGACLGALILLIAEAPAFGWGSAPVILLGLVFIGSLVLWVIVETRAAYPLTDVRVMRDPDVLLANGTGFAFGVTMFICLSVTSLVTQLPSGSGYGAGVPLVWAGLVMLPFSVGTITASRVFEWARRRVDPSLLLPAGAVCLPIALTLLAVGHDELWQLLIGTLMCGFGTGITFGAMPVLISRRVAPWRVGSALSFNAVMRTAGNTVGAAIPGSVFAATMTATGVPSNRGIILAFSIGAGIGAVAAIGIVVALLTRPHPDPLRVSES